MTDKAHVDIYARFPAGDFWIGHADVAAEEQSTERLRQLASLLHELAWDLEEHADKMERVQE